MADGTMELTAEKIVYSFYTVFHGHRKYLHLFPFQIASDGIKKSGIVGITVSHANYYDGFSRVL